MKKLIFILLTLFIATFNLQAQDAIQYITNSMTEIALKVQPGTVITAVNQVVMTTDRYPCHFDLYYVDKSVVRIKQFFLGGKENDYEVSKVYGKDNDIMYNNFKMTKYLLTDESGEFITIYANLTQSIFIFFSSNGYYKTIYQKK